MLSTTTEPHGTHESADIKTPVLLILLGFCRSLAWYSAENAWTDLYSQVDEARQLVGFSDTATCKYRLQYTLHMV